MKKMNKRMITCVLIVLFTTTGVFAQSFFDKDDAYLDFKLGFNSSPSRVDYVNTSPTVRIPVDRDVSSSIAFEVGYHQFKTESFLIGGQLGYFWQSAPNDTSEFEVGSSTVSSLALGGLARKYFAPIKDKVIFFSSLNASYNFFSQDPGNSIVQDTKSAYLKGALDFGVSYKVSDKILLSIIFPDLITFHSDKENFDGRDKGINAFSQTPGTYLMFSLSYYVGHISHVVLQKDNR